MLPIFTSEEMAALDKKVIDEFGIPGMVLMESAARGVFRTAIDILAEEYGPSVYFTELKNQAKYLGLGRAQRISDLPPRMIAEGRVIKIYCGKGNNGGDGLAVARMLDNVGAIVEVVLMCQGKELSGDAKTNYILAKKLEIPIIEEAQDKDLYVDDGCDLVIDALLGTGLKGAARGAYAQAITEINHAPCIVLSIDIPSGVEGSTGEAAGVAVTARTTATMAGLKRGLVFSPGREYAGEVSIVDIGTPIKIVEESNPTLWKISADDIHELIPRRAEDTHKGECGKVFILAGSTGLTGAACMAAGACVRSGAGLVVLGIPDSSNVIAEMKLTEAMTVPLPETDEGSLSSDAEELIFERLDWADACVIGPGLSRNQETLELLRKIIPQLNIPAVIDADALFALANQTDILLNLPKNLIFTPHYGEFARLIGIGPKAVIEERVELVKKAAETWNGAVVLKGSPTIIGAPDGQVFVNSTGNPGMATGGVGDVLSGTLGALLGLGMNAVEAAIVGVHVHGLAGDIAAEERGLMGLSACDLSDRLSRAFREYGF